MSNEGKTFIYGTFWWPAKPKGLLSPPGLERPDTIALEILREFSATELIGKICTREFGAGWTPINPRRLAGFEWHLWYSRMHRWLAFEMEGSGPWEVLHFRNESDEMGLYVAVALRFMAQKPAWFKP
jgi:hypothetical protein